MTPASTHHKLSAIIVEDEELSRETFEIIFKNIVQM